MSRSRLDEQCAAAWQSDAKAHKRGPTRHWEDDPLSHRCPLCGQAIPRLRKAEPWERACRLCGGPRGT